MKLDACDRAVVGILVGKYELSDSTQRARLRELEAAGLITYKVNRYAWWEKSKTNVRKSYTVTRSLYGLFTYNDTEYRTVKSDYYEFCDHYVVDVAVTEKGEKFLTDLPTADHAQELKELGLGMDSEDPSEYIWNQQDLSEEWPIIDNPFIEKKEAPQIVQSKDKEPEPKPQPIEPENVTRIDSLQYQAFMRLDLTKYKYVYFKAFDIRATKVHEIQTYTDTKSGAPKCKAELILTLKHVTDPGRIYYGAQEGSYYFQPIELDYYIDKGWVLDAEPLMDDIQQLCEQQRAEYSQNGTKR